MVDRGPTRILNQPQPGYWRIRLCRGGPFVPACIQWEQTLTDPETGEPMQRSSVLTARIDGHVVHWDRVWHTRGDPITRQQHDYIVALRKWQKRYAPEEWTDPYKPLDLVSMPPIPPPPPETSDE